VDLEEMLNKNDYHNKLRNLSFQLAKIIRDNSSPSPERLILLRMIEDNVEYFLTMTDNQFKHYQQENL
jgi:hypothetical protein